MLSLKKRDEIIFKIECALDKYSYILDSIGLESGITGLCLFYYYKYIDTNKEVYLDKVSYYLNYIFESLSLSSSSNIDNINSLEIIELGRFLCFLNSEELIDNDSTKAYLSNLEPVYEKYLNLKIKEKDLDSTSGVISVGHYYLDSYRLCKSKDKLEQIINFIKDSGTLNEETIYWESVFRKENSKLIESGFFHGISGIIFFLALSYSQEILKNTCLDLIEKGVNYLKKFKLDQGVNLYPIELLKHKNILYSNLAYGDIGIAYSIYKTGIYIENNSYINMGIELFNNAALFRDDENTYIKDAELIYGASGLFAIYEELYRQTSIFLFEEARDYWFEKIISHHKEESDQWAGYETYINGFEEKIQLSFSHGLCGIGISLLSQRTNKSHLKYLSFFNYK